MELCGIIFSDRERPDETGCLKKDNHHDHHIYKTTDGKLIAWEDDYLCDCGCWDEYDKGDGEVCRLMWEVKTIDD